MPYIDAALAFAITMLAVAMIVQQLVILPLRPFRKKQLIASLRVFFSDHLQPIIDKKINDIETQLGGQLDDAMRTSLQATKAKLEESKAHMAEMRQNVLEKLNQKKVAVPGVAHADRTANLADGTLTKTGNTATHENLQGAAIIRVSADEIVGLIRKSNTGKEIEAALGDKADELFDEMKTRYESVREVYRGFLRQNSRWVAVGIGTVFALLFNINTFNLLSVYITSDAARVAVIEQMGEIQGQVQQECSTQAAVNAAPDSALYEKCSSIPGIQQQVNLMQSTMPMGWSDQDIAIFKAILGFGEEEAKEEAETLVEEAEEVAAREGWTSSTPQPTGSSAYTATPNPAGSQDDLNGQITNAFLYWLLGCFTTGLLAGLGTPFWYDTVRVIASFKQRVTAAGQQQKAQGQQTGTQTLPQMTGQTTGQQTPTTS